MPFCYKKKQDTDVHGINIKFHPTQKVSAFYRWWPDAFISSLGEQKSLFRRKQNLLPRNPKWSAGPTAKNPLSTPQPPHALPLQVQASSAIKGLAGRSRAKDPTPLSHIRVSTLPMSPGSTPLPVGVNGGDVGMGVHLKWICWGARCPSFLHTCAPHLGPKH